jgi:PncC family amidohydrolase
LLASTLTDIAGASSWFKKSWVTYANDAKIAELGVDPEELESKGAVSAQVAIQMAKGALSRADADFAISVSGIAGPTNEGSTKPVGTVYVGIASRTWANAIRTQIGGTRAENKAGFVYFAILTAMRCWDDAMKRKTARELEEINAIEEAIRIEAEREAERVRRETEAREHAPWQDEAWSEANDSDGIGLEVEWSESEE